MAGKAHLLVDSFSPMLLDNKERAPFDDPAWLFEIKIDGYRVLAEVAGGQAALRTRNGADCTEWFPEVAGGLRSLPGGPHVLDGEAAVLDDVGRSDFDRLQDRAKRRRWYQGCDPVAYMIFDLLVHNGKNITKLPLAERKARLQKMLTPAPDSVLYMQHFESESVLPFQQAVVPLQLEGLVGKRRDSLYVPGARSRDWVKVKRPGAVPAKRFKTE